MTRSELGFNTSTLPALRINCSGQGGEGAASEGATAVVHPARDNSAWGYGGVAGDDR